MTIRVRCTSPRAFSSLSSKPGHDGFPGARVVGQEEADAREFQEVAIDGFELVGKGIDPGDREREIRVVFVGEAESVCFDADAEVLGGSVEGFGLSGDLELGDLLWAQDRVITAAGLRASADDFQGGPKRDDVENLHHFRDERPADGDALPYLVRRRGGGAHIEVTFGLSLVCGL